MESQTESPALNTLRPALCRHGASLLPASFGFHCYDLCVPFKMGVVSFRTDCTKEQNTLTMQGWAVLLCPSFHFNGFECILLKLGDLPASQHLQNVQRHNCSFYVLIKRKSLSCVIQYWRLWPCVSEHSKCIAAWRFPSVWLVVSHSADLCGAYDVLQMLHFSFKTTFKSIAAKTILGSYFWLVKPFKCHKTRFCSHAEHTDTCLFIAQKFKSGCLESQDLPVIFIDLF